MTPESIAIALNGRKVGRAWQTRCPAHDDRKPSLSITSSKNGQLLFYCHAGCTQGEVLAALQARGLWPGRASRDVTPIQHGAQEKSNKRRDAALAIWRASSSTKGTLAESYLVNRGLKLSLPPTLRFHRALKHREGGTWPALVALVTRGSDDAPLGIHRTFLSPDGLGKAPVEPAKMMLGPCRGGAVRLGPASDLLLIGEGIETCLSAMQATGHTAWAALSTSGMRALTLPKSVQEVIVLADGDGPGEDAARKCALRCQRTGCRARIARSPRGQDFNDLLMGNAPYTGEASK